MKCFVGLLLGMFNDDHPPVIRISHLGVRVNSDITKNYVLRLYNSLLLSDTHFSETIKDVFSYGLSRRLHFPSSFPLYC